jgi:hypothetical protein
MKFEINELKRQLGEVNVELIVIKKDKDILTALMENTRIYLKEKNMNIP